MNRFFARIFKSIYFLILFAVLSFVLVDFSAMALTANHNLTIISPRINSDKDFGLALVYINCFVVLCLSVVELKKCILREFMCFSKQTNLESEKTNVRLLTKVNEFNMNENCLLQLRI